MGRILKLNGLFVLLLTFGMGCESADGVDDETADDDGEGSDDDDDNGDDDDDNGDSDIWDDDDDDDDEPDAGIDTDICDEWEIELNYKPSRLLILQDVSLSMIQDAGGHEIPPPHKWSMAKEAIAAMLETFDEVVEFGVDSFPNPGGNFCYVSQPLLIDTELSASDGINTALAAVTPDGSTPLYLAMENFFDDNYAPLFIDPTFDSYLLVVSDGKDTCGDIYDQWQDSVNHEDLAAITSQLLDEQGIMTFVIGFGEGADPVQLNAIAAAGGTEFDEFIPAEDQQSLEDALETLIGSVISCTYEIEEPDGDNVDKDKINFFFDDVVVPYDEDCTQETGWTWGNAEKTIVEFCKKACDDLQNGVATIRAEWGCETIVVE